MSLALCCANPMCWCDFHSFACRAGWKHQQGNSSSPPGKTSRISSPSWRSNWTRWVFAHRTNVAHMLTGYGGALLKQRGVARHAGSKCKLAVAAGGEPAPSRGAEAAQPHAPRLAGWRRGRGRRASDRRVAAVRACSRARASQQRRVHAAASRLTAAAQATRTHCLAARAQADGLPGPRPPGAGRRAGSDRLRGRRRGRWLQILLSAKGRHDVIRCCGRQFVLCLRIRLRHHGQLCLLHLDMIHDESMRTVSLA